MSWQKYIPEDISKLYEIHDYKHAAAILANEFPEEFQDICLALRSFQLSVLEVKSEGGNESNIPKRFSSVLRNLNWHEMEKKAKVVVEDIDKKNKRIVKTSELNHITHKLDYVKGRVAFDLEWNSKDQTYDRDLIAFKSFFEYDNISIAILVTRSNELDPWFKTLGTFIDKNGNEKPVYKKYGASTTHMGKLLSRMQAGRNGGCPVLIFGITPRLAID